MGLTSRILFDGVRQRLWTFTSFRAVQRSAEFKCIFNHVPDRKLVQLH
jgi:hypothetical protein